MNIEEIDSFERLLKELPENLVKVWERKNLKDRTLLSVVGEWKTAEVAYRKNTIRMSARMMVLFILVPSFVLIWG